MVDLPFVILFLDYLFLHSCSLMQLKINGHPISVRYKSDAVVAQRVAAHIQRRIEEDDWIPFQSKEDALQSWQKLGGIRAEALRTYDLI